MTVSYFNREEFFLIEKPEQKTNRYEKIIFVFIVGFASFNRLIKTQEIENDDAPLKIDTLLLTMPVTVSDGGGRNVAGLKKENFSIFQDGEEQDIAYFLTKKLR